MDVLSPEVLWIENRCYRLPPLDTESGLSNYQTYESNEGFDYEYDPEDEPNDAEKNQASELELDIEYLSDSRYVLRLPIPQTFRSKIIGSKGVTKKRIETDTNTRIFIPKPMEPGDVEIRGSSKKDIVLAKKAIDTIISFSRQKLTFTHFVSLPMTSDEIKKNFLKFKEEVLLSCGSDRGVDEALFQNPDKLHLTIAPVILVDESERKVAEKRLNEVVDQDIRPLLKDVGSGLVVEMRGIEYMNDDPAEVQVLYGRIHSDPDEHLLQELSNRILEHFVSHDLVKSDDKTGVKLHATVMNTTFLSEDPEELNIEMSGAQSRSQKKPRRTFNAVNILEKFQDFYFGRQELKVLELSVRFSTAEGGYYKSSCTVKL